MNREDLEAELRGALEEEIAHLKRTQAERTASAVGGTRLQHAATWVLYSFSLEREFLVPDDSWVQARIGEERLRGIVVSIRGLELTLGLERDMGPAIARVEISMDATAILERVVSRLQEPALSALSDGFARRAFGLERARLSRVEVNSKFPLSADNQEALERAVGSELLFVWGPPGTGKTQTLAALCEVFVERGESVLLTSHTNVAVDEAIWRAAGTGGPLHETPAYFEGKLLRYGATNHPHLMGVEELQAEAVAERLGADLKQRLDDISAALAEIAKERQHLQDVLKEWRNAENAEAESEITDSVLKEAREVHSRRRTEYRQLAVTQQLAKERPEVNADVQRIDSELKRRLEDLSGELATIEQRRRELQEVLEGWTRADQAAAEAESKRRALQGAREALEKRRAEHRHREEELTSASKDLDRTLNPRGLRRLFREDPAPFEAAVRRAAAAENRAQQALASAEAWEARASGEAETAQHEAERLTRLLPLAKQEAFRQDRELQEEETEIARRKEAARQVVIAESEAWEALKSADAWEASAGREAEDAHLEATRLAAIPSLPKEEAQRQDRELEEEAAGLEAQRTRIEQELAQLMKQVLDGATFIASTLTRAAVDDNLCRRSFDNVIIDEASMAPMPLVYLVALAARKRVILVGDFRQLPPIVQAPERDAPLAARWLGRDVFQQAGIDDLDLPGDKAALRADLWEQHRMAPKIREFVSTRFYGGMLRDAPASIRSYDSFWCGQHPPGAAVTMVDTSSLGAWSQRSPGARPSKFNVYSALVAVELAESLLRGLGDPEGGRKPVGIITPYRAQAGLLGVLIRDKKLDHLVRAGTVHSFQGTENDAIIFDYVEDTPNWKAGPLLLEQGPRLMNVAITRARHRFFVLGSLVHARQCLRRSVLWSLVEYAADTHRVMAEDLLREDFLRAVADARARISHGEVADLDASQLRVCTERDFFGALDHDLAMARSRVVLFAPFLGNRAEELAPRLADCVQRGVDVYVITPPLTDQKQGGLRSWYATMHQRLESLGVKLVFFRQMHQKLVFIDDRILYVGGLNPLSHVDTAEIMDRWISRDVFNVHEEQIRLNDLLSVWDDPDDMAMRTCPRDGSPLLVAAPVTHQEYDPMFWACSSWPDSDCGYKRRFSYGPRRSGARVCDKCGTPMRADHKPGGDWWVCGECKRRRKMQEGEGVKPSPAAGRLQTTGAELRIQPAEAPTTTEAAPAMGADDNDLEPNARGADAEDHLRAQLQSLGLEVIDRRAEGGSLWVVGGKDLAGLLAKRGFKFAPGGSRTTRRRPGWYL